MLTRFTLIVFLLITFSATAAAATSTTLATSSGKTTETLSSEGSASTADITKQLIGSLKDSLKKFTKIDTMQWLKAFLAILLGLILHRVVSYLLRNKALVWAKSTNLRSDDLFLRCIMRPVSYFPLVLTIIAVGIILGLDFGTVQAPSLFRSVAITLLVFNIAWLIFNLVDIVAHFLHKLADRTENTLDDELVPLISKALKVIVILMTIVSLGSMVGGPFKGILAGLGLGGLAFALAAKDTVSNLFGYIVIFSDRPFRIGDTIQINGVVGSAEEQGLRSLKMRTLDDTVVVFPNSEVANAQIENFSRRNIRRAFFYVGLTYDTTADQMDDVVNAIRETVDSHSDVVVEKTLIAFETFGPSSLDIRIYYYTRSTGLSSHLKSRQEINLAIMRTVEAKGLSMAFPTSTVHIVQDQTHEEEKGTRQ